MKVSLFAVAALWVGTALAHAQMQQDTLAKLKPILTAEQLAKFQVLMAERGPPGRPH
jgi:hypothetical protein